jgi:uncharacterized protein (TIGR03437 family)
LPTALGGVSVTLDGVPAPLFYVSASQINFQVPFEVAGKQLTKIVVTYLGSQSAAVSVPVLASQPSFFTVNSDGKTAIAFNKSDGKLNSADNPVLHGTYIEIYGTGVGVVSYPIATGLPSPALPANFSGNYTFTVGGSAVAPAYFGGWTPGYVGFAQWDVQIPDNVPTGAVPITVTDASGVSSPAGMTVFVK